MTVRVNDIIKILETIAPRSLAEDWDNAGLQVGDGRWTVERIRIALDPLDEVVQQARRDKIDLLITHHPLIFRPLKSLDISTPIGNILHMALDNRMAIFSAHTNLDSVKGGLNDFLSEKLEIEQTRVLQETKKDDHSKLVVFVPQEYQKKVMISLFDSGAGQIGNYGSCSFRSSGKGTFKPGSGANPFLGTTGMFNEVDEVRIETVISKKKIPEIIDAIKKSHPYETPAYDIYPLVETEFEGLGRIGNLKTPMNLKDFSRQVKNALNLNYLKVAGDYELWVEKVAVCSGSGSGLMKAFLASQAQCYVSGDLHYHDARQAQVFNRGLLDMGHFASEHIVTDLLVHRLRRITEEQGIRVSIDACTLEKDPFRIV